MAAGRFLATTSNNAPADFGDDDPLGVGIALGSNLGDRLENLRRARDQIFALPELQPLRACRSAPVFETEPVDCEPGAPRFLNTVIEVNPATAPSPEILLARLHEIERDLGRTRVKADRNRSRIIDLDLLYVGDIRARSERLILPHPRLSQRRFVLAPLAALRAACVLPGEIRSVAELLAGLQDDPAIVRKFIEVW